MIDIKNKINDIAEKLYSNKLSIEEGTNILFDLLNMGNVLPIGTKVTFNGKKMVITKNDEDFQGEVAYRCDYRNNSLYIISDFDNIELPNE